MQHFVRPERGLKPATTYIQVVSIRKVTSRSAAETSASSELLDVGSGDLIGPGEVLGINQHPDKAEQHREDGNQIAKSSPARLLGVERLLVLVDYDQPLVFHARSLAGA